MGVHCTGSMCPTGVRVRVHARRQLPDARANRMGLARPPTQRTEVCVGLYVGFHHGTSMFAWGRR